MEAGAEDVAKCRKIKIDAANQLMGVTRDVCLKKLNELEGEINHFYSMLDSNEKKSIDRHNVVKIKIIVCWINILDLF